jgi:hypothetical protein
VPAIVGRRVADARTTLATAGLSITGVQDGANEQTTVRTQTPAAGARVAKRTPVQVELAAVGPTLPRIPGAVLLAVALLIIAALVSLFKGRGEKHSTTPKPAPDADPAVAEPALDFEPAAGDATVTLRESELIRLPPLELVGAIDRAEAKFDLRYRNSLTVEDTDE